MFDELGSECPHRGILLDRVPVWNDDDDRHLEVPAGEGKALAVIAPGRAYDPLYLGALAIQALNVGKPASHLECPDRRVVLVLDHHFDAEPLP